MWVDRALLFCNGQWSEVSRMPRLTDKQGIGESGHDRLSVMWVDRALQGNVFPGDCTVRGGQRQAGAARRKAADHLEGRGVHLMRLASVRQASQWLHDIRQTSHPVDVVVSELHLSRHEDCGGLEILQVVDSLWPDDQPSRPFFFLLTPKWDRGVVEAVARSARSQHLRHDDADAIIQAIRSAPCTAALLPRGGSCSIEA
mmetsp:Transcript_39644/g.114061  ORF Transcript_39644/g.114061 Transcript_39644/m.114061 type:complete len:200 (+) Transcript_39644:3-602(+)